MHSRTLWDAPKYTVRLGTQHSGTLWDTFFLCGHRAVGGWRACKGYGTALFAVVDGSFRENPVLLLLLSATLGRGGGGEAWLYVDTV